MSGGIIRGWGAKASPMHGRPLRGQQTCLPTEHTHTHTRTSHFPHSASSTAPSWSPGLIHTDFWLDHPIHILPWAPTLQQRSGKSLINAALSKHLLCVGS